jgi:F0F1-type ATP synthase assembly protein I
LSDKVEENEAGFTVGAMVGILVGALDGPVGLLVGTLVGTLVGALVGVVLIVTDEVSALAETVSSNRRRFSPSGDKTVTNPAISK